jgi:Predicted ATPase
VVGRDAELAELAAAIDGAAGGAGRCVLVSGEAGIGKTRLVAEAAAAARARGHVTLLGRSTPTDQASPLRPLAEALLGALRERQRPDDLTLRPYLPGAWDAGTRTGPTRTATSRRYHRRR